MVKRIMRKKSADPARNIRRRPTKSMKRPEMMREKSAPTMKRPDARPARPMEASKCSIA